IFTEMEDFETFMYIRYNENVGSSSTKISATIQEGIDAAKCVHDGYYVLANDIDATGYERPIVGCQGGWRSTNDFVGKALGLTGTFDGQGHVISNLTMTNLGTGLFELVNGGTIKNLALVNLKSDGTQYLAAFSYIAIDPVIENVYIHIDGDYTMTREYVLCSILHQTKEGAVQLKNVYMDYNFVPNEPGKALYSGVFGAPSGVKNYDWENVYAVSNVGFNCTISKTNIVTAYGYAENEKTGNEYNLILPEGREGSTLNISDYYRCGGAYYYATVADLKAADHDFSSFDTEYWTLEDGVPIWHSLYVEKDPELDFKVNGETDVEEITLHTVEDNSSPFVVTAKYGKNNLETSVEITSGSDYVEYDANTQTITSKGLIGEAVISVSFEINGEQSVKNIAIHVEATTYNYDGTITNFSAIHGDAITGTDFATAFGGDFTSAKDSDGTALTVENNKVYGVKTSKDGKTEKTITLYNNSIGYTVAIEGYSGIFTEMADFEAFSEIRKNFTGTAKISANVIDGLDASKLVFDGYYVLANDIDAGS
ncbi:MAG: hypothetical protein J6W87_01880, partial [Clostridia bacterium]|nr:hypothetical protein [Clostridia bacterium]